MNNPQYKYKISFSEGDKTQGTTLCAGCNKKIKGTQEAYKVQRATDEYYRWACSKKCVDFFILQDI